MPIAKSALKCFFRTRGRSLSEIKTAKTSFPTSGKTNGSTHHENAVAMPIGPFALACTSINHAVPIDPIKIYTIIDCNPILAPKRQRTQYTAKVCKVNGTAPGIVIYEQTDISAVPKADSIKSKV